MPTKPDVEELDEPNVTSVRGMTSEQTPAAVPESGDGGKGEPKNCKVDDDTPVNNVEETPVVMGERRKRSPEESDDGDGSEPKKCKIDDDGTAINNNEVATLSKRQRKKLEKQRVWLENKAKRKELSKEKKQEKKQRKAQMREAGVNVQKVKRKKMEESTCEQRVVLDMSYNEMMSNKDLLKCSDQILRCYGLNRRMEDPMQLYITNIQGKFKKALAKHYGSDNWDIKFHEDSIDKIFKKEEMIYLTSDSSNVLDCIDKSKVYIIGGLVDHNSCKGASLKLAEKLGINHARLPIDEYINMKTRKILTINHVYEIISKVVSGVCWKDAFINTLPKRKMFSAKGEEISLDLDYEDCSKNVFINGEQKEDKTKYLDEKNKSSNEEENKPPNEEENKSLDEKIDNTVN